MCCPRVGHKQQHYLKAGDRFIFVCHYRHYIKEISLFCIKLWGSLCIFGLPKAMYCRLRGKASLCLSSLNIISTPLLCVLRPVHSLFSAEVESKEKQEGMYVMGPGLLCQYQQSSWGQAWKPQMLLWDPVVPLSGLNPCTCTCSLILPVHKLPLNHETLPL